MTFTKSHGMAFQSNYIFTENFQSMISIKNYISEWITPIYKELFLYKSKNFQFITKAKQFDDKSDFLILGYYDAKQNILQNIQISLKAMTATFLKCSIIGDNDDGSLRFEKYDDSKKNYWSIKINGNTISVSCNGDEAISSLCEDSVLDAIEYMKLNFVEGLLDYVSLPGESFEFSNLKLFELYFVRSPNFFV